MFQLHFVPGLFRQAAALAYTPIGEVIPSDYGQFSMGLRRPVGVVGAIAPWNAALILSARSIAAPLALGNTVVLKPSELSPYSGGLVWGEIFAEAGLPAGVLNIVTHAPGEAEPIGDELVENPAVRRINFTGSTAVGRRLAEAAGRQLKRVVLELGGQNPLIVAADAKLDGAVEAAYAGAFWSAGQKCTATRRIYVQDGVYDEFRERFLARIASGQVGDPTDPATEVGPLVNERQLDEVLAGIERGRAEGGTVSAGGERLDRDGYFIAPTVFENVGDESYLSCEEVFGPVTTLYRFAELDEALKRANDVRFGLAASIYTQDVTSVQQFLSKMRAGILHVNSQTAGAEAHVPFGGTKGSGYGPHEQGRAAIEFYTDLVTVYHDA
jgi:acyl-CoA reductase-like NAD-dependent aldehyde dehydrogenase